jgi:hypothetical protein
MSRQQGRDGMSSHKHGVSGHAGHSPKLRMWLRLRGRLIVFVAVIIAVGVNTDGRREVLGRPGAGLPQSVVGTRCAGSHVPASARPGRRRTSPRLRAISRSAMKPIIARKRSVSEPFSRSSSSASLSTVIVVSSRCWFRFGNPALPEIRDDHFARGAPRQTHLAVARRAALSASCTTSRDTDARDRRGSPRPRLNPAHQRVAGQPLARRRRRANPRRRHSRSHQAPRPAHRAQGRLPTQAPARSPWRPPRGSTASPRSRRPVSHGKGLPPARAGPLCGLRGRVATPLDQTTTTGSSCNHRGKPSVPAGFVGIHGRLHRNGHHDTDARDRTRKARPNPQPHRLIIQPHRLIIRCQRMPLNMTRLDRQRWYRCLTSVCHLWRGDRPDQRFGRDDHAE